VRTYIAEPGSGKAQLGRQAGPKKGAVYGTAAHPGERGKRMQGNGVRRSNVTSRISLIPAGMDRLYVRGIEMSIRTAGPGGGMPIWPVMRSIYGAGNPEQPNDQSGRSYSFAILALIRVLESVWEAWRANFQ